MVPQPHCHRSDSTPWYFIDVYVKKRKTTGISIFFYSSVLSLSLFIHFFQTNLPDKMNEKNCASFTYPNGKQTNKRKVYRIKWEQQWRRRRRNTSGNINIYFYINMDATKLYSVFSSTFLFFIICICCRTATVADTQFDHSSCVFYFVCLSFHRNIGMNTTTSMSFSELTVCIQVYIYCSYLYINI